AQSLEGCSCARCTRCRAIRKTGLALRTGESDGILWRGAHATTPPFGRVRGTSFLTTSFRTGQESLLDRIARSLPGGSPSFPGTIQRSLRPREPGDGSFRGTGCSVQEGLQSSAPRASITRFERSCCCHAIL